MSKLTKPQFTKERLSCTIFDARIEPREVVGVWVSETAHATQVETISIAFRGGAVCKIMIPIRSDMSCVDYVIARLDEAMLDEKRRSK